MQAFFQSIVARYYQSLFASIIVLIIGLAFYIGFLEGKQTPNQQVVLSCNQNILSKLSIPLTNLANGVTAHASSGSYVGSKNGTKYYPSTTCTAVKRIKPDNYIWFSSAEDAQIQGYTAGKC